MNKNFFIVVILLFFLLYPDTSFLRAADYSSSSFISRDPVISIEGGRSTSASFENFSSSEVATGENSSTSFIGQSGFLYFPAGTAAVVNPPVTNPIGGGGIISYFLPPNFLPPPSFSPKGADLNGDGKVDIVDLSILLYYANQPYSAQYDFNKDGIIDIVDISILLFYWT